MTGEESKSQSDGGAGFEGQELPGRPESVAQLINNMTPEIHHSLRTAIELGKWQDGSRLSSEQLAHCMEAVILYEAKHLPEAERIGAPLKQECESSQSDSTQTLRFMDENK